MFVFIYLVNTIEMTDLQKIIIIPCLGIVTYIIPLYVRKDSMVIYLWNFVKSRIGILV